MYKQAIVVFGMVIPGFVLVVGLVAVWVALGKFDAKRIAREEALEKNRQTQLAEKTLEAKLVPRRGQMEYWNAVVGRDTIQSFNESLDAILGRFDGNQLGLSATRRPSGKGNFSADTEAKSSLFELTFEGGYGPMQELLAELELRMPQLVMESMKIGPGKHTGRGYQRSLKFEVTYMAWEK